jgi:lipopolysaccharide biosynthesis regulator YciM
LEQVLNEDPSHERAAKSLAKIYEQSGEVAEYARTLEHRARALAGEERFAALCQVARLHEEQLNAPDEGITHYQKVISEDPTYTDALRGLERCYTKLQKHEKLLEVLKSHLEVSRTPRERVEVLARLGDLHELEFLLARLGGDLRAPYGGAQ